MRIISKRTLRVFWEQHPAAREALESWNATMKSRDFQNPNEVKRVFNHADFLGDGVAIFNIKGNDYRLIVNIMYPWKVVFVLWIGPHKEYDKLTRETILRMKSPKNEG